MKLTEYESDGMVITCSFEFTKKSERARFVKVLERMMMERMMMETEEIAPIPQFIVLCEHGMNPASCPECFKSKTSTEWRQIQANEERRLRNT